MATAFTPSCARRRNNPVAITGLHLAFGNKMYERWRRGIQTPSGRADGQLGQPLSVEHLVDVAPLAPNSLCDLRGSDPPLPKLDDPLVIEARRLAGCGDLATTPSVRRPSIAATTSRGRPTGPPFLLVVVPGPSGAIGVPRTVPRVILATPGQRLRRELVPPPLSPRHGLLRLAVEENSRKRIIAPHFLRRPQIAPRINPCAGLFSWSRAR